MLHTCFPERLKSLRQEKNIKQSELAEHLKVTKSAVSGWEVGRNQPSFDILIELSIYFGVSVDYLIGRRNYEYIRGFSLLPPHKAPANPSLQ